VIVGFDGSPVKSSDGLGALIATKQPGDTVKVDLVAPDGSRRTVSATLGVRPLP
jgi:S1-C subfamily serine protease